jgi:hypothetical protein
MPNSNKAAYLKASQLDVRVLSLLELALDLGVEHLSLPGSDEDVFEVDLCFLVFGNVLLVFGVICGYDMGCYLLRGLG